LPKGLPVITACIPPTNADTPAGRGRISSNQSTICRKKAPDRERLVVRTRTGWV